MRHSTVPSVSLDSGNRKSGPLSRLHSDLLNLTVTASALPKVSLAL